MLAARFLSVIIHFSQSAHIMVAVSLIACLSVSVQHRHGINLVRSLSYSTNTVTPSFLKKKRKKLPFADINDRLSAEDAVNNILYNTPNTERTPITRHVVNCLVSNEPGVLSRVSGVLAARGFNIDSLVVSKTEVPDLSRMTIVLNGQDSVIEQAKKQLEDLVPVWAVLDYTHGHVIERELLLVKVWTVPQEHLAEDMDADAVEFEESSNYAASLQRQSLNLTGLSPLLAASLQRQSLNDLAKLFGAKVVNVSLDSVILELCSKSSKINAFLKLLTPYGIIEATRSGVMAMSRSPVEGLLEGMLDDETPTNAHDESAQDGRVDATLLPPG